MLGAFPGVLRRVAFPCPRTHPPTAAQEPSANRWVFSSTHYRSRSRHAACLQASEQYSARFPLDRNDLPHP